LRGRAPPEGGTLEALAAWACQFTSRVSLEPPQAVLLEVEGSLRLFGSAGQLIGLLRSGLAGIGFEARLATGPTPRAALWLARCDGETLEALPIGAIAPAPETLALLHRIGVGTLGELMRLPRAGLAPRFGQGVLDELDRALGKVPEARSFFTLPERFSAQLELPAPVAQAENLLFAAQRLLRLLEGFLAARQAGVRDFTLSLLHRDAQATRIAIGFAAPRRDAEHGLRLLRERLAGLALVGPAEGLRLQAGEPAPLAGATRGLFRDVRSETEDWQRLLERLQARFGGSLVHGLAPRADHRPERAWRAAGEGGAAVSANPRPLWLLASPRPLEEGGFTLLAGPERIESGWWDGEDAARDYFIARTQGGSLSWIYRTPEGWFLHGLFA